MTVDDDPKFDCYIDDIFGAFLAEYTNRGEAIIPLVLSLFGRPNHVKESLPRDPSCPSRSSLPKLGHRNSRSCWVGSHRHSPFPDLVAT